MTAARQGIAAAATGIGARVGGAGAGGCGLADAQEQREEWERGEELEERGGRRKEEAEVRDRGGERVRGEGGLDRG